jgi:hypothetical protein
VAVRSEVTPVKCDHSRRVEMIGQRPWITGGVQNCEVDGQLDSFLGYESPLLACSNPCSFPLSKDRDDRTPDSHVVTQRERPATRVDVLS